jgi:MoxR-like ATPase
MTDLLELITAERMLTRDELLDAIGAVLPVLEVDVSNEAALEATRSVIERSDADDIVTAIVDWWYVVRTGRATPLGLAFRLPERDLGSELAAAMKGLVEVHAGVPPCQWLQSLRRRQELLDQLDDRLDLDWYGHSKLPGERHVWSAFLERRGSAIDALRAGKWAEIPSLDDGAFEGDMAREGIDEGSRRWKEMHRRANELLGHLEELAAETRVTAQDSYVPPPPVDAPGELLAALRSLGDQLLWPVTSDRAAEGPAIDEGAIVSFERAAELADDEGKVILGRIGGRWLKEHTDRIPSLQGVVDRLEKVDASIAALSADGHDTDDAQLLLLEHDLAGAEQAIEDLVGTIETDVQRRRLEDNLDRVSERASERDTPAIAEIRSLLDAQAFQDAQRAIGELDRELRRAERGQVLEQLDGLIDEFRRIDAPSTVYAEIVEDRASLANDPGRTPRSDLVEQARARYDEIRLTMLEDVDALHGEIRSLLDRSHENLPGDIAQDLSIRLDAIGQDLQVGDFVGSKDELLEIRAEIERRRVNRWTEADGEESLVRHLVDVCRSDASFLPEDVRRAYVALKTKPFVILAGLTGSGKSSLARRIAEGFGATVANGQLQRVAVRPDWLDQTEVLGYVNPMSQRFEPGWLADVIRRCHAAPDRLHFVILDEMNLAPVEHYLADVLSAMEEVRSSHTGTFVSLYAPGVQPTNAEDWPPTLRYPENLALFGTVNVDESTRPLTQRVIDRANVIQLGLPRDDRHHRNESDRVAPLAVHLSDWRKVCRTDPVDDHHDLLVEIGDALARMRIGLGIRAHVELERYLANAEGILEPLDALDFGVLQRVVPKVRGFKARLQDGLRDLREILDDEGCRRCVAVLDHWLDDAVPLDEFLDGADAELGVLLSR